MQGQLVDAVTYPQLAALLGQDASGKVTIPDMRDTFPMGAGATALGARGGAASVVLDVSQMPSHSHTGRTGPADRSLATATAGANVGAALLVPVNFKAGFAYNTYANAPYAASDGAQGTDHTHAVTGVDHLHSIAADGGGLAHENRPPFRTVNFIIRAG
jgi:microcystin-dependent protein